MEPSTSKDLKCQLQQVEHDLEDIEGQLSFLIARRSELRKQRKELEDEIEFKNKQNFGSSIFDCDKAKSKWDKKCPWSERLDKTLKKVFKLNEFRPMQKEVINATMEGHDLLLIMSTGGGKSLTFQLPALVEKGITLVVSPLISLMADQVSHLQTYGIEASFLQQDSTKEQVTQFYNAMVDKNVDYLILYITPERFSKSKRLMSKLQKCYAMGRLKRIAIDEVHCVSQWGNDFRPDYKTLNMIKPQFPKTPIIGLTATSTLKVTQDILTILQIPDALIFHSKLNRTNLFYEVRTKPTDSSDLLDEIAAACLETFSGDSGLIYCFSRKDSDDVASELKIRGVSAESYHADKSSHQRQSIHQRWASGIVQVIVATVAFGMGIDKPNCRFVIHHSISKSLENYYQESGRAGRDGKAALCRVYFGFYDISRLSTMVMRELKGLDNLRKMISYCQCVGECRRKAFSKHFGGNDFTCDSMCDSCFIGSHTRSKEITAVTREILHIIDSTCDQDDDNSNNGITAKQLTKRLTQSQRKKANQVSKFTIEELHRITIELMLKGYIKEFFHFTPYSTVSYLQPTLETSQIDELTKTLTLKFQDDSTLSTGEPYAKISKYLSSFKSCIKTSSTTSTTLQQSKRSSSPPNPNDQRPKKQRANLNTNDDVIVIDG